MAETKCPHCGKTASQLVQKLVDIDERLDRQETVSVDDLQEAISCAAQMIDECLAHTSGGAND